MTGKEIINVMDLRIKNYEKDIKEIKAGLTSLKPRGAANEIRKIKAKISECKAELFNLRFSQATGSLEKQARINELRKAVARMKTILRERELQG